MLPTSCTPGVHEFFTLVGRYFQWQMEVLHICLCFMVIREVDPHKLGLTDNLIEVLMEEAKACGTCQPMVIAGDLNAHPVVIPAATTAISSGLFVGLEKAYALRKGESLLSLT